MLQSLSLPYLIGALIALGLMVALCWLRGRVLRCRAQQLRRRMNRRLDAHIRKTSESLDTLRQSIQGLILKVHGVAIRMQKNEPLRIVLDDALDQAESLLAEERDWGIDLDFNGDEHELASMLTAFGKKLRDQQGPGFSVTVQGQVRTLNPGIGFDLFTIGREAILNAFRHARASQVQVVLAYQRRTLQLSVSDNGQGLTPEAMAAARRAGKSGLERMHERAEKLGATLALRSRAGGGSEWSLTLSALAAYRPSERRRLRCWQRWRQ